MKTPEELQAEELAVLNDYQEKHKDRIAQFIKQHPGKALPIYKDKNGLPVWVNRKNRRSNADIK